MKMNPSRASLAAVGLISGVALLMAARAAPADVAFVGNQGDGTVSVIDTGSDKVTRTLPDRNKIGTKIQAVVAQRTVDAAFNENQARIGRWIDAQRGANLDLHVHAERPLGRVFRYDLGTFERARDADVILERSGAMPQGFTVITAYPSAT